MNTKPPVGTKVRMLDVGKIEAEYSGHYVKDRRHDLFAPGTIHEVTDQDGRLKNQVWISDGQAKGFGQSLCPIEWFELAEATPSQIAEEARKAGKATVTTKSLVDPMTVDWPKSEFKVGMEVVAKPERELFNLECVAPLWFHRDDGSDCPAFRDAKGNISYLLYKDVVPLSKICEYEAAQSAQKGPMEPKQVTKQLKETIASKALREAMDKVKADQERVDGIRQIVDLEAKQRANREQAKAISAEIATLSKKWLRGVGK